MDKALKTLEFDKILERLAGQASFSASVELVRALRPTSDLALARQWVAETTEARHLLEVNSDVSVGGARDIRPLASRAARGISLLPQELLDVRHTLQAGRRLKRSILRGDTAYPLLGAMAQGITECPDLVEAIDGALDDQGRVLDSASPKLARLRRELRIVRDRVQERLQRLLNSPSAQYLQEPLISQRGGRWVVPVQSSFKGRIRGIVHDQSASGATLWVEPMTTVDLNNEYREVQLREEEEVQRILAELSARVADKADPIHWTVEALAALDLAFAKAKYADAIRAVEPQLLPFRPAKGLHPGSTVALIQARHPLLDRGTVVPIDVELDDDTYMVVITGPNTGGKTVSLKTVGLLTLMAQSGLHLPCTEATLSAFETVFADIGDEQSIEQSLSTFSGHMVNVVDILERADERSLVALDELGAGTDPTEGSALARAIMGTLRDKGVTTFVATHYPELKLYGHSTPGVTNASVEFDLETLAPTFRLRIGLAGRSNAFAIASRLGLDEEIIDQARGMISDSELRAEDLLESIHRAKNAAEAELETAQDVRAQVEGQRDALQDRLRAIDLERLRVLQDARIQAQAELDAFRDEMRQLRRELSAAGKPLVEIRKLRGEVERVAQELADEPEPLAAVGALDDARPQPTIRVGDTVWIPTLKVEGEVLDLNGEQAEVQIGRLRTRADLTELEWRQSKPPERLERELPRSATRARPTTGIELDLRGERVEAALQRLDSFLDDALLGNVPWVRIIHGKGTGRLRTAVQEALKAHSGVRRYEDGKDGEGGWGVTVAHLEAD
jgi:DNA mismatch repair protein MutS2